MQRFLFKRSIGLIILVIILASIWALRGSDIQQQKQNVVSQNHQPHSSEPISEPVKLKLIKKTEKLSTVLDSDIQIDDTENPQQSTRNILQIYRDLRLAKGCEQYYRLHEEKHARVTARELLHMRNGETQVFTDQQYKAFEFFIQECLLLKEAVLARAETGDSFTNYTFAHPVVSELRKELNHTKAETAEEKHLLEIRQMRPVFSKYFNQLLQVAQGDFKLSEEEQSVVRDEITRLGEEINRLDYTDSEVEILQLSEEIQQQYRLLRERQSADENAKATALKPFIEATEEIKAYLYGRYPYSFETALRTLELSTVNNTFFDINDLYRFESQLSLVPEYLTPSAELQILANVKDKSMFLTLLEPAVNLYMCHLGDDCGPNSHYIRNFCFGNTFRRPLYEQACEMDLMQFYTEVFLTKNQQKDVFALLELMVEAYAL
ncbi:hypothetical protein [Marinicella sp. W31]|uniref:hypothetical protein n=1 Tax=Marinicella sp. W31 TaxID=3023713 RepID=UPI003756A2DC